MKLIFHFLFKTLHTILKPSTSLLTALTASDYSAYKMELLKNRKMELSGAHFIKLHLITIYLKLYMIINLMISITWRKARKKTKFVVH